MIDFAAHQLSRLVTVASDKIFLFLHNLYHLSDSSLTGFTLVIQGSVTESDNQRGKNFHKMLFWLNIIML